MKKEKNRLKFFFFFSQPLPFLSYLPSPSTKPLLLQCATHSATSNTAETSSRQCLWSGAARPLRRLPETAPATEGGTTTAEVAEKRAASAAAATFSSSSSEDSSSLSSPSSGAATSRDPLHSLSSARAGFRDTRTAGGAGSKALAPRAERAARRAPSAAAAAAEATSAGVEVEFFVFSLVLFSQKRVTALSLTKKRAALLRSGGGMRMKEA